MMAWLFECWLGSVVIFRVGAGVRPLSLLWTRAYQASKRAVSVRLLVFVIIKCFMCLCEPLPSFTLAGSLETQ